MLTKNIADLKIKIEAHLDSGRLLTTSRGETILSKDGLIFCLAPDFRPETVTLNYGIPAPLVELLNRMILRQSPDQAVMALAALPDILQPEGKDLGPAIWAFTIDILQNLPVAHENIAGVIAETIFGMECIAAGEPWPELESFSKDFFRKQDSFAAPTGASLSDVRDRAAFAAILPCLDALSLAIQCCWSAARAQDVNQDWLLGCSISNIAAHAQRAATTRNTFHAAHGGESMPENMETKRQMTALLDLISATPVLEFEMQLAVA